MISKEINNILPDEILYSIAEYIKPDKLDDKIQDEIKSEFVFRLFTQYYNNFLNIMNEMEKGKKTNNNENFKYYILNLPLENYKFYIQQLKNYKNDKNEKKINYFIKVIEWVNGLNQQIEFYDDEYYDE